MQVLTTYMLPTSSALVHAGTPMQVIAEVPHVNSF